jgi:hypothetical protein
MGRPIASLLENLKFDVITLAKQGFLIYPVAHLTNRNNHPMKFSLSNLPLPLLKPDIAISPFKIDPERKEVHSVFDVPVLHETSKFLTKMIQIPGARVGFLTQAVQLIVGEYKAQEKDNKAKDV